MEGDGTDNVVRFPRNWFGPLEDLVPFGPAADRAAGADPLRLAADPQAAPEAPALSADAFWGEDAGSIHAVLQPPRAGPGAPAVSADASAAAAAGAGAPTAAGAAAPAAARAVAAAAAAAAAAVAGAPPRSEPTAARHATPWVAAALARRVANRTAAAVFTVLLTLAVAQLATSLLSRRAAPHHSLAAASTGAARARGRTREILDKTRSSAGDNKADEAGGYSRAGLNAQARREASAGHGANPRSHAAASKSAARPARRAELPKSGAASTKRGSSSSSSSTTTNTDQQSTGAAAPPAAAVEPTSSSTYTQTANSGVPVVSDSQLPAASSSLRAVSRSGESASVDSASPLPVPGGPPAP